MIFDERINTLYTYTSIRHGWLKIHLKLTLGTGKNPNRLKSPIQKSLFLFSMIWGEK